MSKRRRKNHSMISWLSLHLCAWNPRFRFWWASLIRTFIYFMVALIINITNIHTVRCTSYAHAQQHACMHACMNVAKCAQYMHVYLFVVCLPCFFSLWTHIHMFWAFGKSGCKFFKPPQAKTIIHYVDKQEKDSNFKPPYLFLTSTYFYVIFKMFMSSHWQRRFVHVVHEVRYAMRYRKYRDLRLIMEQFYIAIQFMYGTNNRRKRA